MTIGEKIKKLRREQDITQEKLAAYLKISPQSVSKWETGNATPEISLLVPLANFFGVTTDELLGRDAESETADIEAYKKESVKLRNDGRVLDDLELWREAAAKYPRNYECLDSLSHSLYKTLDSWVSKDYTQKQREKNAEEVIEICGRILDDCTDSHIRGMALQRLVLTYSRADYKVADEEKAVKYAEMAGDLYTCREILLKHAYFTEDGARKAEKQKHQNILDFMDLIHQYILYSYRTTEEDILACEALLRMWGALIYDGNYVFYHVRIACIYESLAKAYASLGNRDKAIDNLRNMMKHAKKYDGLLKEEHHYTSIFVNLATINTSSTTKNYTCTEEELHKNSMRRSDCFDFIRDDPEFVAILNS